MSEQFDSYHRWLGIAPKDQPPNHYRLLGIDLFEDNSDVIEHAADRQMAHVRSLQAGKHAEAAQNLLNEISAAKVSLLDAEKKSQYDEQLRRAKKKRQELPVATPLLIAEPPKADPASAESMRTPTAEHVSRTTPSRKAKPPMAVVMIGGAAIALVALFAVGAGIVWSFMPPPPRQAATTNTQIDATGQSTAVQLSANVDISPAPPAPLPTAVPQGHGASETNSTVVTAETPSRTQPLPADVEESASDPELADNNAPTVGGQTVDDAPETSPVLNSPDGEDLALADGADLSQRSDNSEQDAATLKRAPVPSKPQRDAKRQEIIAIFRPADAETIDEKRALVHQLLKTARETKGDAPGRFALLNLARDVATAAGDIELSFATVDALDEAFTIDATAIKVVCIEQAARQTLPTETKKQVVTAGTSLVNQLIEADEFEKSAALITTLQQTARPLRDREMLAELSRLRDLGTELFQQYQRASEAFDTLKTSPEDSAANAAAGRYVALVKGDWQQGLPMLANGNDEALRQIAEKELAGPSTGSLQVALADAWWDAAANEPPLVQEQLKSHALAWYQKAAPSLTGLEAAKVKTRIEAASAANGQTASDDSSPAGRPDVGQEETEWTEVPEGGMLSRALSLGVFPHDADDRLIVTFLAKAKLGDDLGGRKLERQTAEKSGKFRGSLVNKTEKYYLFRIRSEKDQAALLVAETFTQWSHSTVDVMVNFRPAPCHGQVPLAKGDNIIIVKHNHNKSDRDDRSWITVSLTGEGLLQGY